MKTIWKFPLSIIEEQMVAMPDNSAILSAQVQDGTLCLWALVQTDNVSVNRKIRITGTGHTLPDDFNMMDTKYIGTAVMHHLVRHVFDEGVQL